jgi:hypothetical protein
MKNYIALASVLMLASCNVPASNADGTPPDTQIRKNGVYQYYIDTAKAHVYIIKMPNGDTCYVTERKGDETYYQSLTSPSISCTK